VPNPTSAEHANYGPKNGSEGDDQEKDSLTDEVVVEPNVKTGPDGEELKDTYC
jgi:hypothetical protein